MAQRRCLRSLAATALLRSLAVRLAQPKEARPIPGRPGDGPGDARQASMRFAVPQEAVIRSSDVVGCSPPLAHQDGPGPGQRACERLGGIVAVAERTGQQAVEL